MRLKQLMQIVLQFDRPSAADLLGLPSWIPRARSKPMQRAIAELDQMVERVLASRRQGGGDRGDLLSLLLAARDEETGEGLSDRQLRDEIMTIFLAGHETTANALAFTWYMLATHPDVDAKLQAELERVLGGRAPVYADLPELRYTPHGVRGDPETIPAGLLDGPHRHRAGRDRRRHGAERCHHQYLSLCHPPKSERCGPIRSVSTRSGSLLTEPRDGIGLLICRSAAAHGSVSVKALP